MVYAVEASNMAHYARQLAAANPSIGERIKVLHGKVEEVEVPEKVGGLLHAVFTDHACSQVGRGGNGGLTGEAGCHSLHTWH